MLDTDLYIEARVPSPKKPTVVCTSTAASVYRRQVPVRGVPQVARCGLTPWAVSGRAREPRPTYCLDVPWRRTLSVGTETARVSTWSIAGLLHTLDAAADIPRLYLWGL